MLIHNYDELNALPEYAVVIDQHGDVFQKNNIGWEGATHSREITRSSFPLELLHPRRFDDHDLANAARAIELRRVWNPKSGPLTLAREALNALEGTTNE